jgi:hypothetical protein
MFQICQNERRGFRCAGAVFAGCVFIPLGSFARMIVVGDIQRAKFETFVLDTCNAQSAERSFRPLFVLKDDSQIEVMRRFGLSFEVLTDPSFIGLSHQQQIERYGRKWGCSLKLMVGRLEDEKDSAPTMARSASGPEQAGRAQQRKVVNSGR